MIRLAYDALRTTPVATDPFPHVVVPNFVPPDELAKVLPGLPAITKRGSFPISALKIRGFAADVIQGLEGRTFRTAVAEKFKLDLNDAPTMVTLRGQTTDRDGHIHTDSKAKRVTVLLYLNPAREAWTKHDGCLRLLRGRIRSSRLEENELKL